MLFKRRQTYFKCPACGYETKDLRVSTEKPVQCPQCGTTVRKGAAFVPTLLVGLVAGLLLSSGMLAAFLLTGTRPVYAIVTAGFIVTVLAWPLSSWLRKLTTRWTKV